MRAPSTKEAQPRDAGEAVVEWRPAVRMLSPPESA
jgi:hypothetical protein